MILQSHGYFASFNESFQKMKIYAYNLMDMITTVRVITFVFVSNIP